VTVYTFPGQGAAVIARSGNSVVVLGAADEAGVVSAAGKEALLLGGDVSSQPKKGRPIYLDFYDNTSFESYVHPMKMDGRKDYWPFFRLLKGGKSINACRSVMMNPAPNVVDWSPIDYEVLEAEREKGLATVKVWNGEAPLWGYNAHPEAMLKVSDTTLFQWNGASISGAHFFAWGMPMETSLQLGLGYLRQVMERYVSSPAVGGWLIDSGAPGDECGFGHDRACLSWDHSVVGQIQWRQWLKEVQHWTLEDLGQRWYNDRNHFTNWDEVMVPDPNEFFGQLGDDSYRLEEGWQTQNVTDSTQDPDDTKWAPVAMPPSQEEAFFPSKGTNYFQDSFDPGDWWKQQKEKGATDVWLVFEQIGTGGNKETAVWWNNNPVDLPKDIESVYGPFAVRVTDLIQSGSNQLRVRLPCISEICRGKLGGTVFLTVHEPKRLPYLGREANARYEDLIGWQYWASAEMIRHNYELARKIDPDRSCILAPGGADGNTSYFCELAADYGIGTQDSGRESNYHPWFSGFGLVNGFYSTGEESNFPPKETPIGDALQRDFGWILFEADSNHSLYGSPEFYMNREKDDGWFTKHQRQIELFGKYLREQPKIVLFRSTESIQYNSQQYRIWDIGRNGTLEKAHYDEVYATEREVKAGMLDRYPVMMDIGSEFMEADVVAAIEKYVENGGTFIALQCTGRHTGLDPDSNPLASLSGFKIANQNETGNVTFASTLPLFKGWEGKQFEGPGVGLEPAENGDAGAGGVGAGDNPVIPLAKWDDGSVAVGYRKVGKGQVIVLGSTFWSNGKDNSGVWQTTDELNRQFLERLFTDCGVNRVTNASLPDIWTRKMVTKNGRQNWLMAFNSLNSEQTADVWMATDGQPDEVIDLDTGGSVPFTFENNGVSIQQVDFKPYEVKVFGVKRGGIVEDLAVWWQEKTTYWKKTPAQLAAAAITLPDARQKGVEDVIPLDEWQFKTDPDNSLSQQTEWLQANYDDTQWEKVKPEPWTILNPALKDYHGTGLYRYKFTLPGDWSGRKILLCLSNWDKPIVYNHGDFFVNGEKVASYDAHGWSQTYNYDITGQVHPGGNILALQVNGGDELGGIGGVIWIESWTPLAPTIDLSGTWQAIQEDYVNQGDATIPGTGAAKYLTRSVEIPADWKGKSVFLQWSSDKQWVGSIMINGCPISYNDASHPFGLFSRVNVTPYLKPGEANTIKVWPFLTMNPAAKDVIQDCQLDTIEIGCK